MSNEETMKWLNLDKKENETKEDVNKNVDNDPVSISISDMKKETIPLENKIVGSHYF